MSVVPHQISVDQHVGRRLQSALRETAMTQVGIAQALGVSDDLVRAWCLGETRVGAEMLFRLTSLTGKRIGYFYEGFGLAWEASALEG